jgi:hypothetical protein
MRSGWTLGLSPRVTADDGERRLKSTGNAAVNVIRAFCTLAALMKSARAVYNHGEISCKRTMICHLHR